MLVYNSSVRKLDTMTAMRMKKDTLLCQILRQKRFQINQSDITFSDQCQSFAQKASKTPIRARFTMARRRPAPSSLRISGQKVASYLGWVGGHFDHRQYNIKLVFSTYNPIYTIHVCTCSHTLSDRSNNQTVVTLSFPRLFSNV